MKKLLTLALASALSLSLFACGDASNSSDTLKVGTESGYPPYEFKITVDGKDQIVGFDMDLAQAIADEMGKELEIVDMAFDSLLVELAQGRVDLVIAGLSYKEEREEVVDMSINYYSSTQSIITLASEKDLYNEYSDFDGKIVGAQLGSLQEDFAYEYLTGAEVLGNDKIDTLILELKTGKIDGIVIETPVAEAKLSVHTDLAIAVDIPLEHLGAGGNVVAIQKGNTELTELVNSVITRVTTNGEFDSWVANAHELQAEHLG